MQQSHWLKDFQCLGDKCEDTCCKGWGMQVDEPTIARYEAFAPELVDAVTSGEAAHIMKRDPETDHCIKYDKGWCGIHADRGSDFLGDACHFFPRITRQMGEKIHQTASLSCPEVARLALLSEPEKNWENYSSERTPTTMHNYLQDDIPSDKAIEMHEAFLNAAMAEDADVGQIIARMHAVTHSMQLVDKATWPMAVSFYLKSADTRLTQAQTKQEDPFHLYHSLAGLVGATKKSHRPRLQAVLDTMHQALNVEINSEQGTISYGEDSFLNLQTMREGWQFTSQQWQPFLKRTLRTELEMAMFPFSGFGKTLTDRMTIIGVRLATLQLALQAHLFVHQTLNEEDAITIVQSLARFLDHLADPTFSMNIYNETGWVKTERLWGLFT